MNLLETSPLKDVPFEAQKLPSKILAYP